MRQTGGVTTNNGLFAGDAAILGGEAVNDGDIGGAARIGAGATLVDNGRLGGRVVISGGFHAQRERRRQRPPRQCRAGAIDATSPAGRSTAAA